VNVADDRRGWLAPATKLREATVELPATWGREHFEAGRAESTVEQSEEGRVVLGEDDTAGGRSIEHGTRPSTARAAG
jgi:hypothetical protein